MVRSALLARSEMYVPSNLTDQILDNVLDKEAGEALMLQLGNIREKSLAALRSPSQDEDFRRSVSMSSTTSFQLSRGLAAIMHMGRGGIDGDGEDATVHQGLSESPRNLRDDSAALPTAAGGAVQVIRTLLNRQAVAAAAEVVMQHCQNFQVENSEAAGFEELEEYPPGNLPGSCDGDDDDSKAESGSSTRQSSASMVVVAPPSPSQPLLTMVCE